MKKTYFTLVIIGLLTFVSIKTYGQSSNIDINKNGAIEPFENTALTIDERVSDLITRLTLEEKAKLTIGIGMEIPGMMKADKPEKVEGQAGSTYPLSSQGISSLILADGPAGLRIQPTRENTDKTFYCTAYPIETALSSSWNTELVKQVGEAMGNEVLEYGVDVLLAPALNIHRNPLAGRNFEYYSEDPYLAGKMTVAMVNGIQSNGVGTSIKHFVANNQETNRMMVNTVVSQRALREIYLRGFEIAIKEAQPWTVMSSYNRLNNVYTSQNPELLTTILRDEWKFKGLVMTDWFAGDDVVTQMKAGNDLIMPGIPAQTNALIEAVKTGKLDEKVLDINIARILKITLQSPSFKNYKYSDAPDLKGHATIARNAAAEGIVLLKNNEKALPLANNLKVAAFGNTSYDFIAGGSGSGDVNEAYTVSLVQGLSSTSSKVNSELQTTYENYLIEEKAKQPKKRFFFELLPPIAEMNLNATLLSKMVDENDVALITIGRNSGEFTDRKTIDDFYLTPAEQTLIEQVSTTFRSKGKKTIVILNIGNVIETNSWKNKPDAIVLAWQGGQEGGNAVADILIGKTTPSGKLPTTFTIQYEDIASSKNFPGLELDQNPVTGTIGFPMGKSSEVVYEEGIYVGYRYFDSFGVKTSYPFGYGLSYTTFDYSDLKLSTTAFKETIDVTVKITNSGKTIGKEVVQLYLSAPALSMNKPVQEMKGFAKTKSLNPGESQVLSFTINKRDLASFDSKISAWIAEKGDYVVKIGASSQDHKLSKSFNVKEEIIVEKTNDVLHPNRVIEELSKK